MIQDINPEPSQLTGAAISQIVQLGTKELSYLYRGTSLHSVKPQQAPISPSIQTGLCDTHSQLVTIQINPQNL